MNGDHAIVVTQRNCRMEFPERLRAELQLLTNTIMEIEITVKYRYDLTLKFNKN
jgi:hypothetical protein